MALLCIFASPLLGRERCPETAEKVLFDPIEAASLHLNIAPNESKVLLGMERLRAQLLVAAFESARLKSQDRQLLQAFSRTIHNRFMEAHSKGGLSREAALEIVEKSLAELGITMIQQIKLEISEALVRYPKPHRVYNVVNSAEIEPSLRDFVTHLMAREELKFPVDEVTVRRLVTFLKDFHTGWFYMFTGFEKGIFETNDVVQKFRHHCRFKRFPQQLENDLVQFFKFFLDRKPHPFSENRFMADVDELYLKEARNIRRDGKSEIAQEARRIYPSNVVSMNHSTNGNVNGNGHAQPQGLSYKPRPRPERNGKSQTPPTNGNGRFAPIEIPHLSVNEIKELFERLSLSDGEHKKLLSAIERLEARLPTERFRRVVAAIANPLWQLEQHQNPHLITGILGTRSHGVYEIRPAGPKEAIRFWFGKEGDYIRILHLDDNAKSGQDHEHKLIQELGVQWESIVRERKKTLADSKNNR